MTGIAELHTTSYQYHYFSHGVKRGDHFLVSNRKGQAWLIWMTGTCSGSLFLAMCWLFPRCHMMPFSDTFPMWRMWPSKTIFCRVLELGPKHCSQVTEVLDQRHPTTLHSWSPEALKIMDDIAAPPIVPQVGLAVLECFGMFWKLECDNVHFLATIRIIGCVYQTSLVTSDLQARAIEPQEVTGHKKGRSSFCSGLLQNLILVSQGDNISRAVVPRVLVASLQTSLPIVREAAEFTKKQIATIVINLLYTIVYCWFTIVACHSGNCSMMSWRLSALWCSRTGTGLTAHWAVGVLGSGQNCARCNEVCAGPSHPVHKYNEHDMSIVSYNNSLKWSRRSVGDNATEFRSSHKSNSPIGDFNIAKLHAVHRSKNLCSLYSCSEHRIWDAVGWERSNHVTCCGVVSTYLGFDDVRVIVKLYSNVCHCA